MTFLLFRIGPDRYAIELARVAEVLPRLVLKSLPQAAPGLAGAFDHHGTPVPVVDLSAMAAGRPAGDSLSSRILLIRHGPEKRLLGLLVEAATETAAFSPSDFRPSGAVIAATPYLGPVATDSRGGLVQRVEVDALLTPEVRAQLWPAAA